MRAKNLLLALSIALLIRPVFPANESNGATDPELDEVTVISQAELHALRRAMVAAEDAFYSRYNTLNTVDDFIIECREEAPTGSRLTRRKCLANYELAAIRKEGVEGFWIRQWVHDESKGKNLMPSSPPVPAAVATEARRPAFQRHVKDMIYRNPELIQLLEDRDAAISRFQEARRALYADDDRETASDDALPSPERTPSTQQ